MVKVERAPKATNQTKPRDRITMKDLPPDLTSDGDWQEFRRIFLAWVGALKTPWNNQEDDVVDALTVIGCAYRGEGYQLTTRGAEYAEASQVCHSFLTCEFLLLSFLFSRLYNDLVNGGILLAPLPSGPFTTGLMNSPIFVTLTPIALNGHLLPLTTTDTFTKFHLVKTPYVYLFVFNLTLTPGSRVQAYFSMRLCSACSQHISLL